MKSLIWQIALGALLFPSVLLAQTQPSDNVSISPVRELNLRGFNFLYVDKQVTRAMIGDAAKTEVPKLFRTLRDAHIDPIGPMVFIYPDMPADPQAEFDLEIGITVGPDAVAPDGYDVEQVPPTDCQTVLFGGAMAKIGRAFAKLMPKLHDGTVTPTGEIREYILYFEDAASPNNVCLIAGAVR
jgi:hypothetical protein